VTPFLAPSVQDESVRPLVREVFVKPMRFVPIQLRYDTFILFAVGSAGLLFLLKPRTGVLLHESRKLTRHSVEGGGLGVVRPFEFHSGFQRFRVVVIDREPNVVR
jgi:hypothetical protein